MQLQLDGELIEGDLFISPFSLYNFTGNTAAALFSIFTGHIHSIHCMLPARPRCAECAVIATPAPATAATPYTEGVAARERGHEVSDYRDIGVDTLDSHAAPGLSIDTYLLFKPNFSPLFHSFIHILTADMRPPHGQLPDYHHPIPRRPR